MHKRYIPLLFVAFLSVAACGRKQIDLPKGPQQINGILESVPLSATRRGTHVLKVEGKPLVFVESLTVPLDQFEGMTVIVQGTLRENNDPSLLPVLIATDVRPPSLILKQWTLESAKMKFSAPEEWTVQSNSLGYTFTGSGSFDPVLRIRKVDLTTLPAGSVSAVGGQKAVTVNDGSGQIIYVQHNKDIIAFAFFPKGSDEQKHSLAYAFKQLLKSVSFAGSSTSASSQAAGTGTVLGTPCGGEAGILCLSGSYCEVTDAQTNVGRCKMLR